MERFFQIAGIRIRARKNVYGKKGVVWYLPVSQGYITSGCNAAESACAFRQKFSSKSLDYFDRITGASKRMRALIEDLLAYSRANTAERKFERKKLNILLNAAVEDLKETILEKHAIVEISDLPEADVIPFQFQQMAINIISNALKFAKTNQTPHISIKAEVVLGKSITNLVAVDADKLYICLSFSDNGIGFSMEYNKKIFEVFQRLHNRSEYSGTGVGLAICKKIVENHNGAIYAEGKLNEGATFNVLIPAVWN